MVPELMYMTIADFHHIRELSMPPLSNLNLSPEPTPATGYTTNTHSYFNPEPVAAQGQFHMQAQAQQQQQQQPMPLTGAANPAASIQSWAAGAGAARVAVRAIAAPPTALHSREPPIFCRCHRNRAGKSATITFTDNDLPNQW